MKLTLSINGTPIKPPPPSGIEYQTYNLTKSGRVASGKMTMDLIAKKRKLVIKYPVISSSERKTIMDLINGTAMFFTVEYIEDDVMQCGTFYVGQITGTPQRTSGANGGQWYWKDFKFDLIEQ